MSFLLKIVEGPNKGAEIALVEGVAVTFGKGDACDVVLADATLPDAPLSIEASASGVTVDGAALEPLHVKTVGATSFAVGPADAPWGALAWEGDEMNQEGKEDRPEGADASEKPAAGKPDEPEKPEVAQEPEKPARRGGCFGCLVAQVVLLVLLAGLAWLFRDRLGEIDYGKLFGKMGSPASAGISVTGACTLADIADKYSLTLVEEDGVQSLSGNLRTRRERLAATAEAYATQPGVDLDLSDDESFRSAAEDALFTLTEGALKVESATNRVLAVGGSCPSAAILERTLKALNMDLPKMRGVDVKGVLLGGTGGRELSAVASAGEMVPGETAAAPRSAARPASDKKASPSPTFPVCGILTVPYPCLVMRDGRRILEGASVGDWVIERIEADYVTVTNATGRFTWKP